MTVKKLAACAIIAFTVALAVVVGNRMSAEAMAVVIGVICGVAASIPMSAIILALSRRSRPATDENPGPRGGPPVVVIAPPAMGQSPARWPEYSQTCPYPAPVIPASREYRVIGDEPL